MNTAGASDADRADAALELLRKIHQPDRERLRLYREKRGEEAKRLRVVRVMERELLPELWDADERTGLTLARLILSAPRPIREGELLLLRDRLTGQLPDGRWTIVKPGKPLRTCASTSTRRASRPTRQ